MPQPTPASAILTLEQYLSCLGGPFPEPPPLAVQSQGKRPSDGFSLETLSYESEPGERVPAFFLLPDGAGPEKPVPGILLLHQHAGEFHLGKSEPAGLAGNPMHATGADLARLGFAVLCPDSLGFEERRHPRFKGRDSDFERFAFVKCISEGRSLAWKNVLDIRRAVDVLSSRPEVLPRRIGAYGHSLGATQGWLAAPLEPRLKALVGNCCLPTYRGIFGEFINHCFSNYVPGLLKYGDVGDVLALIAPRPCLCNAGSQDPLSPIGEVHAAVARAREAYERAGARENLEYYEEPVGHVLSPGMKKRAFGFLEKHLKG